MCLNSCPTLMLETSLRIFVLECDSSDQMYLCLALLTESYIGRVVCKIEFVLSQ